MTQSQEQKEAQEEVHLKGWRFSLASLFAVVLVLALICVALHYLIRSYESSRRMVTKNDFRSVLLAIANFSDSHGNLPRAQHIPGADAASLSEHMLAEPTSSWRLQVLPYLQKTPPQGDRNQPWNAPVNAVWRDTRTSFSLYRSDGAARVLAITGPGTAFGANQDALKSLDSLPADVILVAECLNSGLHWTQPGDFEIRSLATPDDADRRRLSSEHLGGFHVGFADGEVWFLRNDTPIEVLQKFFTVEGAQIYNRDELLAPYRLHH